MEKKRFILDNGVNRAVNEGKIKELTVLLRNLNEKGLTEDLKEKGLKELVYPQRDSDTEI